MVVIEFSVNGNDAGVGVKRFNQVNCSGGLAEALRLGRYHPLDIHRRGNSHRVWLSWYQHYFVWGMTAGIIRELALQIGARP